MPLFGNQQQNQATAVWEPQAADGRLAQTAGARRASWRWRGCRPKRRRPMRQASWG